MSLESRLKKLERRHGFKNAEEKREFHKFANKWGLDWSKINRPSDFWKTSKEVIPDYFSDREQDDSRFIPYFS